jgi:hypothetical protein
MGTGNVAGIRKTDDRLEMYVFSKNDTKLKI